MPNHGPRPFIPEPVFEPIDTWLVGRLVCPECGHGSFTEEVPYEEEWRRDLQRSDQLLEGRIAPEHALVGVTYERRDGFTKATVGGMTRSSALAPDLYDDLLCACEACGHQANAYLEPGFLAAPGEPSGLLSEGQFDCAETEPCDRCGRIVVGGEGCYWPDDERHPDFQHDQERLCRHCFAGSAT